MINETIAGVFQKSIHIPTIKSNEVINAFMHFDKSKEPPIVLGLTGKWTKQTLRIQDVLGLEVFLDLTDPTELKSIFSVHNITTIGDYASLLIQNPEILSTHPFFERCDEGFEAMLANNMPPVFLSKMATMTEGNIIDGNHRLIMMAHNYLRNPEKNNSFTSYTAEFRLPEFLNWNRGSFQTQYRAEPKMAFDLAYRRIRANASGQSRL